MILSPLFTEDNCRRVCREQIQALPSLPNEPFEAKIERFWRPLVLNSSDGFGKNLRDQAKPGPEIHASALSLITEERIL